MTTCLKAIFNNRRQDLMELHRKRKDLFISHSTYLASLYHGRIFHIPKCPRSRRITPEPIKRRKKSTVQPA